MNMATILKSIAVVCALTCLMAARPAIAVAQLRPATPGEKPASPDAPFLGAAAMGGLAEIEHGRLAARSAASPDVKRFAQRMVDDHQKASEELKGLASQREVTLATKLDDQHQSTHEALGKLQGAAFDRAYMAQMVKAHLEAVTLFQQEAKNGEDADVRAWAAKMLPTIQEHVKLASSLHATVDKGAK
jgi:putative membrane protein